MKGEVGDFQGHLDAILQLFLCETAGEDRLFGSLPVNQIMQLLCFDVELGQLVCPGFHIPKFFFSSNFENFINSKLPVLSI